MTGLKTTETGERADGSDWGGDETTHPTGKKLWIPLALKLITVITIIVVIVNINRFRYDRCCCYFFLAAGMRDTPAQTASMRIAYFNTECLVWLRAIYTTNGDDRATISIKISNFPPVVGYGRVKQISLGPFRTPPPPAGG
uniref:Uncharacterized protein n=1 Tax=Anopheles culicifacies TaxID=139723 RepID=A0A182LS64_9DIPT